MITEKIILYENREDVTLTTYILEDSPEMLKGKTRPAILICPGGAYLNCSDREAEPVALRFAAMGYHAFVLRYSTYGEGHFEWPDKEISLTPKLQCQYPAQIREIGQSMMLIHEYAKKWSVNTNRIALCGFSAGAHNVALYAVNWHKELIHGFSHTDRVKLRPAAMILGYGLSDYAHDWGEHNTSDAMLRKMSNISFLGTENPSHEMTEEVSPVRFVDEHTPPAFLWSTSEDELVPVQHSIKMAHALADKQIPFELHIFENGAHGLSLASQATSGSRTQVDHDVAKWIELAGCWLEKRFALPLA